MKILRTMEVLAAIMLIAAAFGLLGYKCVEHVSSMMAPHARALEVVAR